MNVASLPSPFPPGLRRIGVFAPAGRPDPQRLALGLSCLRAWGVEPVVPPLGAPERFFSAPDGQRSAALNALIQDASIDGLMAIQGGYGCSRLLADIDWERLRDRSLPLLGYSDLTAIHAMAFKQGCRHNVAGPMVASTLGRGVDSSMARTKMLGVLQSLAQALRGTPGPVQHTPLAGMRAGVATGLLFPANLSVLAHLVGTPFMPNLQGCLVILEDVNEAAYRVDRYLNQLAQAGELRGISGLVFGQFTAVEDAEWLPAVLTEYAGKIDGPVASGLAFGHAFPSISLPVGRRGTLEVDADRAVLALS